MTATAFLAVLLAGVAVLVWPRRRHLARSRSAGGPASMPGAGSPTSTGSLGVPVLIELLCAALEAGLPTASAVEAVLLAAGDAVPVADRLALRGLLTGAGAARRSPRSPAVAVDDGPLARVRRALAVSDRTGASAARVLRRAAVDERAAHRRRVARATGRLGVRLVLPLGLTVLPSFVLLGVVPVVLGLAAQLRLW